MTEDDAAGMAEDDAVGMAGMECGGGITRDGGSDGAGVTAAGMAVRGGEWRRRNQVPHYIVYAIPRLAKRAGRAYNQRSTPAP